MKKLKRILKWVGIVSGALLLMFAATLRAEEDREQQHQRAQRKAEQQREKLDPEIERRGNAFYDALSDIEKEGGLLAVDITAMLEIYPDLIGPRIVHPKAAADAIRHYQELWYFLQRDELIYERDTNLKRRGTSSTTTSSLLLRDEVDLDRKRRIVMTLCKDMIGKYHDSFRECFTEKYLEAVNDSLFRMSHFHRYDTSPKMRGYSRIEEQKLFATREISRRLGYSRPRWSYALGYEIHQWNNYVMSFGPPLQDEKRQCELEYFIRQRLRKKWKRSTAEAIHKGLTFTEDN